MADSDGGQSPMNDIADDASDMPPFWGIQYLKLTTAEDREAGLRATAMNFCCGPDGLLKDFEKHFPIVLALIRGGDSQSNVTPFKPKVVPDDASG